MGTTPLGAQVLFTSDDRARVGVKLTARVGGSVTPQLVTGLLATQRRGTGA